MSVYSPVVPSTASSNVVVVFDVAKTNRTAIKATPVVVENVTRNCFLGYFTREKYICANGAQMNISCNGRFTGKVMNRCPTITQRTVCNSLSSPSHVQTVTTTDSGCTELG